MAKTLMIQGTTSDAGKTTLVAALCRAMANRQLSVCPFKPQNMALNSAVTCDGGEIGRSQALQAIACRIEAETDMNPVLLKPTTDVDAQVIVHGKAISAMEAAEYHDYKQIAKQAVLDSHERLAKRFEFIIAEGAGSPAEINLREGDIANMGFAEAIDCPVIIVADIDKGGVFAHLVGTLALLSESEQNRVIGFVINKFRGDIELLQPGLDWLEERTGKPVLGVLPYLHDVFVDAEDAIDKQQLKEQVKLKIVVPVLPHISNHTDFDVMRNHPEIDLEFISVFDPLPACDILILPGSKNVRGDYEELVMHGWDHKIKQHLRYGGHLIGICGGYQMLGHTIADPLGIESTAGFSNCFALVPMHTELKPGKTLENCELTLELSGEIARLHAYEIHCGESNFLEKSGHPFRDEFDNQLGYLSDDGQIMGCYYHGIFDNHEVLSLIAKWVGVTVSDSVDLHQLREQELEKLAHCLEQAVDLDALFNKLQPR
jgi:adenosylcobyric acid synthase